MPLVQVQARAKQSRRDGNIDAVITDLCQSITNVAASVKAQSDSIAKLSKLSARVDNFDIKLTGIETEIAAIEDRMRIAAEAAETANTGVKAKLDVIKAQLMFDPIADLKLTMKGLPQSFAVAADGALSMTTVEGKTVQVLPAPKSVEPAPAIELPDYSERFEAIEAKILALPKSFAVDADGNFMAISSIGEIDRIALMLPKADDGRIDALSGQFNALSEQISEVSGQFDALSGQVDALSRHVNALPNVPDHSETIAAVAERVSRQDAAISHLPRTFMIDASGVLTAVDGCGTLTQVGAVKGSDGVSVQTAALVADELILTLSDGRTLNLGKLVQPQPNSVKPSATVLKSLRNDAKVSLTNLRKAFGLTLSELKELLNEADASK